MNIYVEHQKYKTGPTTTLETTLLIFKIQL